MALLKEMKSRRAGFDQLSERVEIVDKFKTIYSSLYNSATIEAEMVTLFKKVGQLIAPDSLAKVARLNGGVVKLAVSKLRLKKSNVSTQFTPDIFSCIQELAGSWQYYTMSPCLLFPAPS